MAHATYYTYFSSVLLVYLTVGAAIPSVVETILLSLMNDTFEGAYHKLMQVLGESGGMRECCWLMESVISDRSIRIYGNRSGGGSGCCTSRLVVVVVVVVVVV